MTSNFQTKECTFSSLYVPVHDSYNKFNNINNSNIINFCQILSDDSKPWSHGAPFVIWVYHEFKSENFFTCKIKTAYIDFYQTLHSWEPHALGPHFSSYFLMISFCPMIQVATVV